MASVLFGVIVMLFSSLSLTAVARGFPCYCRGVSWESQSIWMNPGSPNSSSTSAHGATLLTRICRLNYKQCHASIDQHDMQKWRTWWLVHLRSTLDSLHDCCKQCTSKNVAYRQISHGYRSICGRLGGLRYDVRDLFRLLILILKKCLWLPWHFQDSPRDCISCDSRQLSFSGQRHQLLGLSLLIWSLCLSGHAVRIRKD